MAAGAVIATGTAVELYAARKASKASREALEAQATERERAAVEVMERFEIRSELQRMEVTGLIASQGGAFSKGGVDLGSGTPLLAAEEASRLSERAISMAKRESQFQADELFREASAERKMAKDEKKAFRLRAASTILNTAGSTYMAKKGGKP
jgi:hypothetical protein